MTDHLPTLSIVIPAYNAAHYITETLDCLMAQDYPGLEIWVIDGGGSDETVDILKSYGSRINWLSEPDKGQSHALNKGLRQARGEILGWLNADDLYEPGALHKAGKTFLQHPGFQWIVGPCSIIDDRGRKIRRWVTWYKTRRLANYSYASHLTENYICTMGVFFRRGILAEVGYFNESFHLAMDYDFWLRLGAVHKPLVLKEFLGRFRMYPASKSMRFFRKQFQEDLAIAKSHAKGRHRWRYIWHLFNHIKILTVYQVLAFLRQQFQRRTFREPD